MTLTGGCHCGAVRYVIADGASPHHVAACHCTDCRRASGAPLVGWALFDRENVAVTGAAKIYRSSEQAERLFCGDCGSGLFYVNEAMFPGGIDVQIATLDDPDAVPAQAQIQTAERIGWVARLHELPAFERYPAA